MITFNSIEDLKKYYHKESNTYVFNEDVKFNFNLMIDSSLIAHNIDARNIIAHNIDAWNIKAHNIDARNIKAGNIDALDIKVGNIDALDIDARNIKAGDIKAWNIDARNIAYYAVCVAYNSFSCESVKGGRRNSTHTCLDGDIVIRKQKKSVPSNTFIGKRLDNGQFTQGYLFEHWGKSYILWGLVNEHPDMIEVDPKTVRQYTTLKGETK